MLIVQSSYIFLDLEIETSYSHVCRFLSKSTPEKCWESMFALKDQLKVENFLLVVEICVVLPISSAEVERVFSSFANMVTKDRKRLNNQSMEVVLRIHNYNEVLTDEAHETAMDLFLSEYPNGDIRKGKRRVDGYKKQEPKKAKTVRRGLTLDLTALSSSEESSSSSSDESSSSSDESSSSSDGSMSSENEA